MNSAILIFILLFPYNPNICLEQGCSVMHYPIPAHVMVYTSFEDARRDWYEGVIAYRYDGTGGLVQLKIKETFETVEEIKIKKELSDKPVEFKFIKEGWIGLIPKEN